MTLQPREFTSVEVAFVDHGGPGHVRLVQGSARVAADGDVMVRSGIRPARITVLAIHVGHRVEVLGVAVTLPEDALAKLRTLQEQMLSVGDIWWTPEAHAKYPGGKDRFCLIVAIERPAGGAGAVVHFVAGSRGRSTANTIKVDSGSCGLNQDTYFRFWWAGEIGSTALVEHGTLRGSLPATRLPEIEAAIKASKLGHLKRLLR